MKFVLLCDLVRAPGAKDAPVIGMRLTGAALRATAPGEDVAKAAEPLFSDVSGLPLPEAGGADFSGYLDRLAKGAGPLFPWIGGDIEFAALWASFPAGNPTAPPVTDLDGFTLQDIPLPAGGAGTPDYHLTDTALAALRHAALADLVSAEHTANFTLLDPFVLAGLGDDNTRRRIDETYEDACDYRYEALMAGLACLPAPIPHGGLNLVRFARLTAARKPNPGETCLMVAAPRLTILSGAVLQPDFSQVVWSGKGASAIATIPYKSPFNTYAVEAICRAIDPVSVPASAASFIDLDTLWVRRRHSDAAADDPRAGIGFEDWLARLPARASEAFDLPRLLLLALENDAAAPGSPLNAAIAARDRREGARRLTLSTLAALRDIVGPGVVTKPDGSVLKGPNGSPAHRTIIAQVNLLVRGAKLDAGGAARFATLLEQDDKAFRDAVRMGGTSAGAALSAWIALLAGIIAPTLELPAEGEAFVMSIAEQIAGAPDLNGPYDAAPLRKIVDAAVDPANAAAIQLAIWRKATEADPTFQRWLVDAAEAFARLLQQKFDMVSVLRRANVDLPWICAAGIWHKSAPGTARDIDLLRGSETEKGSIREAIGAYALGTLCEAAGTAAGLEASYEDLHGRVAALPAGARDALEDALDAAVAGRVGTWFAEPDMDDGGETLLSGPLVPDAHPLVLQIDRFVVSQSAEADFNDDLAGYGVLMRRSQPPGNWCCLTASYAEIDPDQTLGSGPCPVEFKTADRTVLGALPVGYMGPAPQATVVYDNHPILGDMQQSVGIEHQQGDEPAARIVRLVQPARQDNPPKATLIPFLAYGATYEIAPFGISNQGALPETIRKTEHPALLATEKLTDNLFGADGDIVRRFAYLRRTGIGALRVAADPLPDGQSYHPLAPGKDTRPLAEEILVASQLVEPWFPPSTPATVRPLKMKTAVLLADGRRGKVDGSCGRLQLRIDPPVTPLEDFDRWIALDEALLKDDDPNRDEFRTFRRGLRDRQQALTQELDECERQLATARGEDAAELQRRIAEIREDLILQDPAVDGLAIRVERVRRDGTGVASGGTFAPLILPWAWQWRPGTKIDAPFVTRTPVLLNCRLGERTDDLFDKDSLTVTLVAGDVVIVQIFAAVRKERFSDPVLPGGERRFDRVVRDSCIGSMPGTPLPDGALPVDEKGQAYRLFSLHALAVEGASQEMPSPTGLAAAIAGRVVTGFAAADEHEGDIRLQFTRTPSVAMDAVGSITVGTQAWRWTGRPLPPFPFKPAGDFNDFPVGDPADPNDSNPANRREPPSPSLYPLLWDVFGFAERLDETLGDLTVASPISETVGTDGAAHPRAARIALNSPQRLEPTRYLRFRARATSRYTAAYERAGIALERPRALWANPGASWSSGWYRMLRPATATKSPPKPGVKAILPLTRAPHDGGELSPVSGVLVIIDGAWYEQAGLAEWLLAGTEIAYRRKLVDPETGNEAPARAAEFGPDPLVRTHGLGRDTQASISPKTDELRSVAPLALAGPLGHGFDTGTATGLILNSSFVVRPPGFADTDPAAWWMGKIAFRRLTLAEATESYWDDVQALPIHSTAAQISLTQHDIAASGEKATIRLVLQASLGDGKRDLAVKGVRAGGKWALDFGDGTLEMKAAGFDARVIAVRRSSLIDPENSGGPRYAWFDIVLLLRETGGHWFLAWQDRWFNAPPPGATKDTSGDPLTLDMKVEKAGATSGDIRVCNALQLSEPTEGRWTQFLPNMEVLGRLGKVPVASLPLKLHPQDRTKLLLAAAGGWLATNGLTKERAASRKDQGLFSLLLVTAGIANGAGGTDEAYIGLYHSPDGRADGSGNITLEPFEPHGPAPPEKGPLYGRILTVRTGKPTVADNDIAAWRTDAWRAFFPPEAEDTIDPHRVFAEQPPGDAPLQIIEIYAPIPFRDR